MGGMNLGPAPIGMGNLMGGVGGIGGIQNNPLGGIGGIGGLTANGTGIDNSLVGGPLDNSGGLLANPVLSGMGLQGGFQGGLPMGMGGMGKPWPRPCDDHRLELLSQSPHLFFVNKIIHRFLLNLYSFIAI